jgi:hypothetical protein
VDVWPRLTRATERCSSSCSRPTSPPYVSHAWAAGFRSSGPRCSACADSAASSTSPNALALPDRRRFSQAIARSSTAPLPQRLNESSEPERLGAVGAAAVRAAVPSRQQFVGEFAAGHAAADVLRELVQNEYDAQGRALTVTFGSDGLAISGTWRVIDSAGWRRLSVILGALTVREFQRHQTHQRPMEARREQFAREGFIHLPTIALEDLSSLR